MQSLVMLQSQDTETYLLGDVLIRKAHRGKLQEVVLLLQLPQSNVNYQNKHGCTALHGAAASGQLEVVQCLLNYANIDCKLVDHEHQTALHYAAFYGHLEVTQLLILRGVPLNIPDKIGRYAHFSAAINGHLDVVRYLLEECPQTMDINAIDDYGGTCLHWAAAKGRSEVVQYLCYIGIDIHITSYDNKTAYQLAVEKHKVKCVQVLKLRYEISKRFVRAAEEGENAVISEIMNEINGDYPLHYMRDKNGKNAMHWAAESGHLSTLKLLGENFQVWTDADKFGRSILHWAALGGHKDCVMWIIRNARDASKFLTATGTHKTPSRCAFEAGHSSVAGRLKDWEEGNDEYTSSHDDQPTPIIETPTIVEHRISPNQARDIEIVQNWLKSIQMGEYTTDFIQDGFDKLRGIAMIDEKDLVEMNVKKGHRRMLNSKIEELRKQLALLDKNAQAAGREPDPSPTLASLSQMVNASIGSITQSSKSALTHSASMPHHSV